VPKDLRSALTDLLPRLRRFGMSLTGSRVDADDLVQMACERALSREFQLRTAARLDSWMYSIMRNLWVDEVRARQVRRADRIDDYEKASFANGDAIAEARMTLAAVRRALMQLPEEQRTVLTLVCVDGLSYKEAAQVLGVPVGTVMSRLARGRQELHRKLTPAGRGDNVSRLELLQ
jgi:RNA polymerase sigma-70 factor (ECF subfamily)